MDNNFKELDERYVKRVEYIETITVIRKDIGVIKWICGLIAVGTISPIVEKLMDYIVK